MELLEFHALSLSIAFFVLFMLWRLLWSWWIIPNRAYQKLRRNGFTGPTPSFPLGNISDMKKKVVLNAHSSSLSSNISHDIHSTLFPYYARWQKSYGKVFIYWLGTEPFLYIADPEFLRQMSACVMSKSWGKPSVFKHDRQPLFGNGLTMVEGDEWVRHRQLITPAFSPPNLKAMGSLMVESTSNMLARWTALINSGRAEIDVEREIMSTTGEIIAKTIFGISYEYVIQVFDKLRALQVTLFKSSRAVGVPFSKLMHHRHTLKSKRLGKEIDALLFSIIMARKKSKDGRPQRDLLGLLLEQNTVEGLFGKALTPRELVDECKTLFFGGYDTSALAVTWTLLLLAMHPEWQNQLREEIMEVVGDRELDATLLVGLKKMGWVMNEVIRLYSPAPNLQRQAREDIQVDRVVIPKGTNMWIDVIAIHHDPSLWGEDVNEFKPDRFIDDLYGGCNNKMGFLPFGFGGRMCLGRNLTIMEYKFFLTSILTHFSFTPSPNYFHSPSTLLTLRPTHGLPLIFEPL